MLPYGRQLIDDDDIAAVTEALRSDWLTTGPRVSTFEKAIADFVGAKHGVAVSNGTAALHAAMHTLRIGPGDEVIVPPITFAATANAVVYMGATPIFADVDPDTLLIDPTAIEAKITPRTRAIIAVDYAGQPCDWDRLQAIAHHHKLALVDDACHALGARYHDRPLGTWADLTVFSFHPVKHITTGEGGCITTEHDHYAANMRDFRCHGITLDSHAREQRGSWFYEMKELGYNYRLTDLQGALGASQLKKLPGWLVRRSEIANRYRCAFAEVPGIVPLSFRSDRTHAWHLFVVRVQEHLYGLNRDQLFTALRAQGIGAHVHYIPVHLHPFYRERFQTGPGLCPLAEAAYAEILTLPLHHGMTDTEVDQVIEAVRIASKASGGPA